MYSIIQKKDLQLFYSSIFLIADKEYLYQYRKYFTCLKYEGFHKFVLTLQHVLKQIFSPKKKQKLSSIG